MYNAVSLTALLGSIDLFSWNYPSNMPAFQPIMLFIMLAYLSRMTGHIVLSLLNGATTYPMM